LRLRPGDVVGAADGTGERGLAVVLRRLDRGGGEGEVVGEFPLAREPRWSIAAYPSLLQRDKFEQALQKLVEIGASSITPVLTSRGQVRTLPDDARLARWRAIMREAAEQCGRGVVPALGVPCLFQHAIAQAVREGPTLLAYESRAETVPLREGLLKIGTMPSPLALFVGPEGGYDAQEVALARQTGATVVSLGPRILRTETASPVFAALVLFGLGDLD
jgi:16S rRNA (uracil1498-N3)-methyltransferase